MQIQKKFESKETKQGLNFFHDMGKCCIVSVELNTEHKIW